MENAFSTVMLILHKPTAALAFPLERSPHLGFLNQVHQPMGNASGIAFERNGLLPCQFTARPEAFLHSAA